MRWENNFKYPPFQALATPYGVASHSPYAFHLGDCSSRHLIRYDVFVGIVDFLIGVDISIDIPIVDLLIDDPLFEYAETYPLDWEVGPVGLVSGCLVTVTEAKPAKFTGA